MKKQTAKTTKTDGWQNVQTGLGTFADKRRHTHFAPNGIISDAQLEAIYADDGLGARIIDLLPDDMLRNGFHFDFWTEKEGDEEYSRKYMEILDSIHFFEKIADGFKWARLYGGAIAIIGAFDGQDFSEPLEPTKIKKFDKITIVPRPRINLGMCEYQNDPKQPRYGEIERYSVEIQTGMVFSMRKIHYTRVIEFHSVKIPTFAVSDVPYQYRYWGVPVLNRVYDRLSDLGASFGSLSTLIQEVCIGKFKFKDLGELLSTKEGGKMLTNRIAAMELTKSVYHSIYMDTEEDFIRDVIPFNGVSDVIYQFFMLISASTGYPMTRLFGISPAGLNSTGDSDTYNYYDMVKAKQQTELKPIIMRFISIIGQWLKMPIPMIEFESLEQLDEKEKADIEQEKALTEKTKMETYKGYYELGVMEPYMIEDLEFGETLKKIKEPSALPDIDEE